MKIVMLKDEIIHCGWKRFFANKGELHTIPDSIATHLVKKGVARAANFQEALHDVETAGA